MLTSDVDRSEVDSSVICHKLPCNSCRYGLQIPVDKFSTTVDVYLVTCLRNLRLTAMSSVTDFPTFIGAIAGTGPSTTTLTIDKHYVITHYVISLSP